MAQTGKRIGRLCVGASSKLAQVGGCLPFSGSDGMIMVISGCIESPMLSVALPLEPHEVFAPIINIVAALGMEVCFLCLYGHPEGQ